MPTTRPFCAGVEHSRRCVSTAGARSSYGSISGGSPSRRVVWDCRRPSSRKSSRLSRPRSRRLPRKRPCCVSMRPPGAPTAAVRSRSCSSRRCRPIWVEFRPSDLIGGVKSTSYALNMVAVDQAKARGADDAVFLAGDETVLEATTSNLWWRRGRTLYTPSLHLGILAGVTRAVLIKTAPALGFEVEEGIFPVPELAAAEEAFTSSSVREVMPVVALDGRSIGDGAPGEGTRELQAALRET